MLKNPPINTVFRFRYQTTATTTIITTIITIIIKLNFKKMIKAKFWKIELPINSITTNLKSAEQKNKLNKCKSRDQNFYFANQRTTLAMIKRFNYAMKMLSDFRIKQDHALQIIIIFEMHLVDNQMQLLKQLQNLIDHLLTQKKNDRNLPLINMLERAQSA